MLSRLSILDRAVARTRPAWRWIGEFSLIALGIHLAADHCEDLLFNLFVRLGVGQIDPVGWATHAAILLELTVASRVVMLLLVTAGAPTLTWRGVRETWCIETFTRVLFWIPTGLAGAWALAMAIEDATAPYLGGGAFYVSTVVAVFCAWRLLFPALGRLLGGMFSPRRRIDGWPWAPPLLLTAAVSARYGLPIWAGAP